MLVVVHHGDVHFSLQALFDLETLRGLDIFEVDAAESRAESLDDIYKLVGVGLVDFNVKAVETREYFEKQTLAFHHGLAGQSADIAQTEHCRAVGDHGHKIALVGIFVNIVRIVFDLKAGIGHAGRVGQGQVGLGGIGFGGDYFDFSGARITVIVQRHFFCDFCHVNWYGVCMLMISIF